jgi:Ca2+-binding EF-hand superfamily protein
VSYNLLFRRWPRLEIDRIISEVTASLTVADNEGYINIAELCQLVGLVNQGRLPSTQPFASSFRWFDSHDEGNYSLKITRVRHTVL